MKGLILLSHNEDTRKVENEEKNRFLRDLLAQMGVPIDDLYPEDNSLLSVDQRIKLKNLLAAYSVQLIESHDGDLQVFVENEKVGEFYKPTYVLKRDISQKDKKKQLYLEMMIHFDSVFDEPVGEQ